MKKKLSLMKFLSSGCASFGKGYKFNSKLQSEYFNESGEKAEYGVPIECIKQSTEQTERSPPIQYCGTNQE